MVGRLEVVPAPASDAIVGSHSLLPIVLSVGPKAGGNDGAVDEE